MTTEIKLCKDCALLIHIGDKCGRSVAVPDYVHGMPIQTVRAQDERTYDTGRSCGPSAKFFVPIVLARHDYSETMLRRDQAVRLDGTTAQDLDVVGRALKAGH